MRTRWILQERTLARQNAAAFAKRVFSLSLRQRIDVVLVTGVLGSLLLLLVACLVVVEVSRREGWLDPEIIRELRDERLRVNVRDHISEEPMLSAALHPPEGELFLSQSGGTLHRYDPITRLWSSESPLRGRLNSPDLIMLRSGCGNDAFADGPDFCADKDSLWGLTASGALVRRGNRQWDVIFSDSTFLGLNGRPVTEDALTSAAVSEDKRWLVVGTRGEGFGIYRIGERRWLSLGAAVNEQVPITSVTHVVWWQDRFWIGGPNGLARLDLAGERPELHRVPEVHGEVLDLDEAADGLYVLTQAQCDNGQQACLWLGKFSSGNKPPTPLLAERNLYPEDLNLSSFSFAQFYGNRLTISGEKGIFSYDTELHSWTRHFSATVLSTLSLPGNDGFYFGYAGGVALYSNAAITSTWAITSERISKLMYGEEGELLAVSQPGSKGSNVYSLLRGRSAIPVFVGTQTDRDPARYRNAFAVGETIALLGPEGATLHNAASRSYSDIALSSLPRWMSENAQYATAGDRLYALLPPDAGRVAVYSVPAAPLSDPAAYRRDMSGETQEAVPGPVRRFWSWGNSGLGLLAGDGSVYRVGLAGREQLTGPAVPEMGRTTIIDVTSIDQDLVVAVTGGLRRYSATARAWGALADAPLGATISEIDSVGGQLLIRTDKGLLLQAGIQQPLRIGDPDGFAMGDDGLSDAHLSGNALYLAGEGAVNRYSLSQRHVTGEWKLGTSDVVELRGLVGELPLSLSSGQGFIGEKQLDTDGGRIVGLSGDGNLVYAVLEDGQRRYLKIYDSNGANARCFFRQPALGLAFNQVIDARATAQGTIVAVTTSGTYVYSPAARSWYPGPSDLLGEGGRVYLVGDTLAFVGNRNATLHLDLANVATLRLPDSCSTGSAELSRQSIDIVAFAVDERKGKLAWLDSRGAVSEYVQGQSREILPPVTAGPPETELRRAYLRSYSTGAQLLLTTDDRIWRYELAKRRWSQVRLDFGSISPVPLEDINLEQTSDTEIVTARSVTGDSFVGSFRPSDSQAKVTRVLKADSASFGASPKDLLDVQLRGGDLWAFVLTDRVKYLDPRTRTWQETVRLPSSDQTLWFGRAAGRAVLVGEGGQAWWIGTSPSDAPTEFVRYALRSGDQTAVDADGVIYRLSPGGLLEKCTAERGRYTCVSASAPPLLLDPNAVTRAFPWGARTLVFQTLDGLRAYDQDKWRELAVPELAARFTGTKVARSDGSRLFLFDGARILVLARGAGDKAEATLADGVRDLVFDSEGKPWAQLSTGWQVWSGSGFVPMQLAGVPFTDTYRVFVVEGATPTAISDRGTLYAGSKTFISETLPLPTSIVPAQVTSLYWSEAGTGWWVQSGRRLDHIIRDTCPALADASALITPTVPISTALVTPTMPVGTPVVTPAPTPTQLPCLRVAGSALLPAQFGTGAQGAIRKVVFRTRDSIDLIGASGLGVSVGPGTSGVYEATPITVTLPIPRGMVDDQWPKLRANTTQLPDGEWAYDPILRLEVLGQGELFQARPTGRLRLAEKAALAVETVSPLDAKWLVWDRNHGGRFRVATPNGLVSIPKDRFVEDTRLLFELPGVAIAERVDRIHVGTRRGVWTYSQGDLRLNDPLIVFTQIDLSFPLSAAHGRFITGVGDLILGEEKLQTATPVLDMRFGDVTVSENLGTRRVTASVQVGQTKPSAFVGQGFLWDSNRRGLAYVDGKLQLQSDTGIGPVDSLAGFDPGPSDMARAEAQLLNEADGEVYLRKGQQWFRRLPQGWSAGQSNPASTRVLFDDARWRWSVKADTPEVLLKGDVYSFGYGGTGTEYTFTCDRLLGASGFEGRLYVMTAAFLEEATSPDDLAQLTARRHLPAATDSLEQVAFADGRSGLFRRSGAQVTRWDQNNRQFASVAPGDNPFNRVVAVQTDRLRMTRFGYQVIKEIRVEEPDTTDAWIPFDFYERQFPFDVITSMASFDGELYLGSRVGLEVYGSTATGLSDLKHLYGLRASNTRPLVPTYRVGVPDADPTLLMALSEEVCVERRPGAVFTPCKDRVSLNTRLRASTDLWRWSADPDGTITGRYLDDQRRPVSDPIQINDGRLPHDRIKDVTICAGQASSLWEAGWITVHPTNTLALVSGVISYPRSDTQPERLLCLERDIKVASSTATRGLYYASRDGRMFLNASSGWLEVTDSRVRTALVDRIQRPPIFDRARLRLVTSADGKELLFEHQNNAGRWSILPWEGGRLAIDRWQEVQFIDGGFWSATSAGLVRLGRAGGAGAGHPVQLDAERLIIVPHPVPKSGSCRVTDLAVGVQPSTLDLRCNSDRTQVYTGKLSEDRDEAVFELRGRDPFVGRRLVSPDTGINWVWDLDGREASRPGILSARLFAETIQLREGRFAFDSVSSLALLDDEWIDLGTGGGWFKASRNHFGLGGWQRPANSGVQISKVVFVGRTQLLDKKADGLLLCVCYGNNGSDCRVLTKSDLEPRSARACAEYQGEDSLWHYQRELGKLRIIGRDIVGSEAVRSLAAGRFTDDVVTGLPVASLREGETIRLVPTRAGVLRLNREFATVGIYAFKATQPGAEDAPRVLYPLDISNVGYASADGLRSLEGNHDLLASSPWQLPPGVSVLAAERGPYDYSIRIWWSDSGGAGWTLAKPEGVLPSRQLPIDLSFLPRFSERAAEWGQPSHWLLLSFHRAEIVVTGSNGERTYTVPLPAGFQLVKPIVLDARVILVGRNELLELNLEPLVSKVFS